MLLSPHSSWELISEGIQMPTEQICWKYQKSITKEKKEFTQSLATGKKTLLIISTIFLSIFLLFKKVSKFPKGNLTSFSLSRAYCHLQNNINYCQQILPLIIQNMHPKKIMIYRRCQKAFTIVTIIKTNSFLSIVSYSLCLSTFKRGKIFQKILEECVLCVCLWTFMYPQRC